MDQVAQVREKIDIISFISEYLSLKKAGKNFQALCPFHGEKTPSFVISPERQIWHCFGCGKGGDIYTFIMEYEHIEFPEALRILAKQAGIELARASFADSATSSKKDKLYKVNSLAQEFYHYILLKHPAGKNALDYLDKRGVDRRVVETFKLGFSPASGRALVRYLLQKKHFQKEDLIESGLAISYCNGLADFFRGRLIFPLIDDRDNVLGFSGRLLNENTGFGGKYINTRDTLVYHKRTHFFGFNITKENIRKSKQAILVEGEFDVLSMFQNGYANVLAVKGTALTAEQVNLISRFAEKITICFDEDSAGHEAIKRSLPIISKKGLNTTVIVIPVGKDPDEAFRVNPTEFKNAIKSDINVYDFLFEHSLKKYSVNTSEGKESIAESLLPVISGIENAIIKEHYLRKLSEIIKTSYESITEELTKKNKKTLEEVTVQAKILKRPRDEVLGEYLTALVFQSHDVARSAEMVWNILSGLKIKEQGYLKLIDYYLHFIQGKNHNDFSAFVPSEYLDTYNTALIYPLPEFIDESKMILETKKTADQLRLIHVKQQLKSIAEAIKKNEVDGKESESGSLKEEYSKLVSMLKG